MLILYNINNRNRAGRPCRLSRSKIFIRELTGCLCPAVLVKGKNFRAGAYTQPTTDASILINDCFHKTYQSFHHISDTGKNFYPTGTIISVLPPFYVKNGMVFSSSHAVSFMPHKKQSLFSLMNHNPLPLQAHRWNAWKELASRYLHKALASGKLQSGLMYFLPGFRSY